MTNRFSRLTAATVLATSCLLGAGQIANAAPTGSAPPPTDMDRLKARGYTCERNGATGGYTCQKKGERDQLCDNAGTCESVKINLPPDRRFTTPVLLPPTLPKIGF